MKIILKLVIICCKQCDIQQSHIQLMTAVQQKDAYYITVRCPSDEI